MPRALRAVLPIFVLLSLGSPAGAQFTDATGPSSLWWFDTSWGASLADLDQDGTLDVYAGHHFSPPVIFWNEGDGTFDFLLYPQPWSGDTDRHGALAVRLNNDDHYDLFIGHGAAGGGTPEPNEVYRNDGGGFLISLSGAAGMNDPSARARTASAHDYDGDYKIDVWVGNAPNVAAPNRLFRMVSTFNFTEVSATVGLDEVLGTGGGIWGDYDDDGDPDLLVGGEEFERPTNLYRNDAGSFVDDSSVFAPPLPIASGADWGDLDNDGDLDLALCDGQVGVFDTWAEGDSVTFFFNTRYNENGVDGLTIPSTADTVITRLLIRGIPDPSLIFLGPAMVGPPPNTVFPLTDDYVGAPSFTPGVDRGIFIWRTAPGGDWEVRCSTPLTGLDTFNGWFTEDVPISGTTDSDLEDANFVSGGPRVWRNDGGTFIEVSTAWGLPAAMSNPRDISWVDYDNDGDLDLHVVDMGTSADPNEPDALFRNDGSTFTDVTGPENLAGGTAGMGDGGVWGDLDNDGDLDLYLKEGAGPRAFSTFGPSVYLRNDGDRGNSIQVELKGRNSGVNAFGSKVTVWVGGQAIERRVTANSWRGFQDPMRLHFGIGGAALADSMIIDWSNAAPHRYVNVQPGIYALQEEIIALGVVRDLSSSGPGWTLAHARPQPARGRQTILLTTPRPAYFRVTVHDVTGRLVRALQAGTLPEGTTSLVWDGGNDDGRPVAPGVYFYRATDGTTSITRKSIRLR